MVKHHTSIHRYIALLFVLIWQTLPALAQTVDKTSVAANIERIITNTDPYVNIGMVIVNLDDDQILYQRNPQRHYTPASLLKLFTSVAALVYAGADHTFSTALLANAQQIDNGTLSANIYLKLSGDPSLSQDDLQQLLAQFKSKYHIKRIDGDFIIDSSVFNTQAPYGPGWMLEDTYFAYSTRLSPIILDQNQINLIIKPNKRVGKAALVEVESPNNQLIAVTNQTSTAAKNADCRIKSETNTDNSVTLSGCIARNADSVAKDLAIDDPLAYSEQVITQILAEQNIQLNGKIAIGETPDKVTQLAEVTSAPLLQLITEPLKESNNLFADALLLRLAADYYGSPGDWKPGAQAIKKILQDKLNLDLNQSVIVDGSGLSRYNLITPAQFSQLLTWLYHNLPNNEAVMAALPLAGKDGTLEDFPLNGNASGYLRAKTGTMSGIANLAGYLTTQQEQNLAFVIMIDGFSGPTDHYMQLIGNITDYLHSNLNVIP